MISKEKFKEVEMQHGCGYWHVCDDHSCPCAITTENKGYDKELYQKWENQWVPQPIFDIDIDFEDSDEGLLDEEEVEGCYKGCESCSSCLGPCS